MRPVSLSQPARTAAYVAVFAVVLAPWTIRNWNLHHRFLVTSTEGGLTLLECNNPLAFSIGGDQVNGFAMRDPVLAERLRALSA
ncbi:MAG: hypothetical protein HGA94_05110, partial [Candidatus Aminicenantes bacterium]|nr:hypothetical protein [Candidatus Aminicenantes bacterium]